MRSMTGREKACTVPASIADWGITRWPGLPVPPATSAHVIRANDLRRRAYQSQPNGDWRLETRPASVKNTEPPPVAG